MLQLVTKTGILEVRTTTNASYSMIIQCLLITLNVPIVVRKINVTFLYILGRIPCSHLQNKISQYLVSAWCSMIVYR